MSVRWFYQSKEWIAYDDEANQQIEKEFVQSLRKNGEINLSNKYLINVLKMTQTRLQTRKVRKICRALWFTSPESAFKESKQAKGSQNCQPTSEASSIFLETAFEQLQKNSDVHSITVMLDSNTNKYTLLTKSSIYHKVVKPNNSESTTSDLIYRGYENSPIYNFQKAFPNSSLSESLEKTNKTEQTNLNNSTNITTTTNTTTITAIIDHEMIENKWFDLPIDIWRTILDYLSFSKPSSLAILCMTCKFFNKLMPDQTFWKNMYSKRYGIEIAEIYQTKRQRQCKTWKQKFGFQFVIERNLYKHKGNFPVSEILNIAQLQLQNKKITSLSIVPSSFPSFFVNLNQWNYFGSYGILKK